MSGRHTWPRPDEPDPTPPRARCQPAAPPAHLARERQRPGRLDLQCASSEPIEGRECQARPGGFCTTSPGPSPRPSPDVHGAQLPGAAVPDSWFLCRGRTTSRQINGLYAAISGRAPRSRLPFMGAGDCGTATPFPCRRSLHGEAGCRIQLHGPCPVPAAASARSPRLPHSPAIRGCFEQWKLFLPGRWVQQCCWPVSHRCLRRVLGACVWQLGNASQARAPSHLLAHPSNSQSPDVILSREGGRLPSDFRSSRAGVAVRTRSQSTMQVSLMAVQGAGLSVVPGLLQPREAV